MAKYFVQHEDGVSFHPLLTLIQDNDVEQVVQWIEKQLDRKRKNGRVALIWAIIPFRKENSKTAFKVFSAIFSFSLFRILSIIIFLN